MGFSGPNAQGNPVGIITHYDIRNAILEKKYDLKNHPSTP